MKNHLVRISGATSVRHSIGEYVLARPRVKRLLTTDHFSVDGTLVDAWASMKSFKPRDGAPDDDTLTFLELGDATSCNLKFSHRDDVWVSYGEETITETNLLEIRRRHPEHVRVRTFGGGAVRWGTPAESGNSPDDGDGCARRPGAR